MKQLLLPLALVVFARCSPAALILRGRTTPTLGYSAYGYTTLTFDSGTDVLVGYSETDMDPDLVEYYESWVIGRLLDSNGNSLSSGGARDTVGAGYASITLQYIGKAGATYRMYGTHNGYMGACDCVEGNNYYDGYNESYWNSQDIVDATGFFNFYGDLNDSPVLKTPTITMGESYDSATISIPAACGDDRDAIIKEYFALGVTLHPVCPSFSSSVPPDSLFTFSQLNTSYYPDWAILLNSLYTGIRVTQSNYGSTLTPTSGYRDPRKEKDIDTQQGVRNWTVNSRHEYGDAIDLGTGNSQTKFNSIRSAGLKAGACAEPVGQSGLNHVHLDWRQSDGVVCSAAWLR